MHTSRREIQTLGGAPSSETRQAESSPRLALVVRRGVVDALAGEIPRKYKLDVALRKTRKGIHSPVHT